MDLDKILQNIQQKFGAAPRKFNLWDKLTWLKQDFPEWDWENEDIRHSVNHWARALTHGKLSWGHIVQVNTLMFEKDTTNCPGEVLIWKDKNNPFDIEFFEWAAQELFELKGQSEHIDDEYEKEFAEYLEDEHIRAYGIKVPEAIANDKDLRVSTVFFQRRHLPNGIICSSLLPIVYLEEFPMVVAMVPYTFWPKEFLEFWTAQG
ncbi:MAG: hypothetical protein HYZ42_12980 [Bacteroidetes bacterium]|nr:hypothetical protein [Bacteroidota bacterium]